MTHPKVSICILSFNRAKLLYHSLMRMKYDLKYPKSQLEFLVIDNGSTDASVPMVKTFFPNVQLFSLNQNQGITSWNTLIEAATGEYILLLDDDAYLIEDNLTSAVDALIQNPKAAALAIRAINPKGKIDFNYAYPTGVLSYWGCSALFKASVLKALKGYDPSFFFQAFELDLSLRLKELGYEILFSPDIWGIHLTEPNYQPNGFKFYVSRRNLMYVVQKHFTGLLKYKLLLRLSIMTCIQGRQFNLKTPLKAIIHGFLKGRKLDKRPVSKQLQHLYANDFSEFQAVALQRVMWKNRDFWIEKKESYPHLTAPFPELKSKPNRLLVFLHRMNMDGATHMVLKALQNQSFFNSFGSVTVISTENGVLKENFETLGAIVRIIPSEAHLHVGNRFYEAIKHEIEYHLNQADFVWINTLHHAASLFKMLHNFHEPILIYGHESLAPDSPVLREISLSDACRETISILTRKPNVTLAFPSSSTADYAKTFFHSKHVSLLPYGIKTEARPHFQRYDNLDCVKFLVTGWICERKNQKTIIPIFEYISKYIKESTHKMRSFELNFVGTAYSFEEYKQLMDLAIKDVGVFRVNFYPMLSNEKILDLMKQHHFVLIPSLGEALCVSALEMMGTGGIAISSDCEGSEDIFDHMKNGFKLPRNAYGHWTKLITELLDPTLYTSEDLIKIAHESWKKANSFRMHHYIQSLHKALKHPIHSILDNTARVDIQNSQGVYS